MVADIIYDPGYVSPGSRWEKKQQTLTFEVTTNREEEPLEEFIRSPTNSNAKKDNHYMSKQEDRRRAMEAVRTISRSHNENGTPYATSRIKPLK